MAFGVPQDPAARVGFVDIPQSPMAAAVQKPKVNWLGVLADALSGAAGQTPLYTQGLLQRRQQDREEQTYQHHRQDQMDMWRQQYQYELEHPKPQEPSQTERMMARYLDPNTPPDEKALIGQQLIKPQAVTVTNPDGSQELRFIYPGQQQPQGPRVFRQLPPDAVPIDGGPSPRGSGGFR